MTKAATKRFLQSLPSDCSWVDRKLLAAGMNDLMIMHILGYIEIQINFITTDESIAITPLGLKAIGRRRKKSRAPKSPAKSPMHSP
jgi:hypothetical protein